jgi:hypothetical protein
MFSLKSMTKLEDLTVSNFVKAYSRTAEKSKHFCAALGYVLVANRIYWNLNNRHK